MFAPSATESMHSVHMLLRFGDSARMPGIGLRGQLVYLVIAIGFSTHLHSLVTVNRTLKVDPWLRPFSQY